MGTRTADGRASEPQLRPRAVPLRVLAGLTIGLLATAGCGQGGGAEAPKRRVAPPAPVVLATVASRDLAYVVEGTGSLEAYQIVTVPARVDGVVEAVSFEEGGLVDPTIDLAVVDRSRRLLEQAAAETAVALAEAAVPTAQAAVPRAEAAVERATAGVERAAAQERAATTDLRESQEMFARREALRASSPGAVSEEEFATMRTQRDRRRDAVAVAEAMRREADGAKREAEGARAVATAAVLEAQANVGQAQAKRALAERTAADTVVRSPIRGVVRRRLVTPGQYLRAGDAVAEIVDRSRLRVRFRVTEAESPRVATGMGATLVLPALGARRHDATIVHVDETASAVTRMVECLAELPDPEATLKPGFYAVVTVETKTARALAVPDGALQPGERGWIAYVVEDGKARARVLTLGLRTRDGLVEVVDGLKEGEALVVRGANVLADGAAGAPATGTPATGTPPTGAMDVGR